MVLNSSVVAFDRIVNISKNVIRHSKRNDPVFMDSKQEFRRSDEQYQNAQAKYDFNRVAHICSVEEIIISKRNGSQYKKRDGRFIKNKNTCNNDL